MDFTISSGHSLHVRGASGLPSGLDEVNEARKVTDKVAQYLKQLGSKVNTYHDNVSRSQSQNINNIVRQHNTTSRDLDISVHFNAHQKTDKPMGCEVLYVNDNYKDEAAKLSKAIADAGGFKDRGAKKRTNLGFLNGTNKPALLLEICFCDSNEDTRLYNANFDAICRAISESLTGKKLAAPVSSASKPVTKPVETKPEIKGDDDELFKLDSATVKAELRVFILRLTEKEPGFDKQWLDKFDKGVITNSEMIMLLMLAVKRGMLDIQDK